MELYRNLSPLWTARAHPKKLPRWSFKLFRRGTGRACCPQLVRMLTVELQVGAHRARALVDTGSSLTLVSRCITKGKVRWGAPVQLEMMDGSCIWTYGCVTFQDILVEKRAVERIDAHVLPVPPAGVDVVFFLLFCFLHVLQYV